MYWASIDIKVNLIGMEIEMLLRTPSRKGAGVRLPRPRMACIQPLAIRQMVSVCKNSEGTAPHLCENSFAMEVNNSGGHQSHDSSSHNKENACLLPSSDDQSPGVENMRNKFLWQAARTSAKYDKSARRRFEQ